MGCGIWAGVKKKFKFKFKFKNKFKMITIEQPAMVLNANATPAIARYQMWNSWDVQGTHSPQHIIEWVASVAANAAGQKLKNLVIQCHGAPGFIGIGQGFSRANVNLFSGLAGKVDKIWIVACQPALISTASCAPSAFCSTDGNLFISEMAKSAQCYVVAPTETQWNLAQTYQFGVIPSYEGLVLCYGPGGNITWQRRYPSDWPSNHE
jgi:hypothetical protein